MSLSVHLLRPPDAEGLAHLRAQLDPEVQLTWDQVLPTPADYQILVAGRPERVHITASPRLQALVIPWAGLPTQTAALMKEFPAIAVHNLHYNAVPTAELAFTLLLTAAKWIVPMDRSLRAHDWTPRHLPNPALILEGGTALILGYGAIGQHVARLCRGLGMKVVAIRRNVAGSPPDSPDEIHPPEALHHLLPGAHALIVCLPLTPATEGFIGAEELALLPSDAVLVNIGRGPIVDEAALYSALQEGALYAAGIDVWYDYPPDEASRSYWPPSAYPFHELDNVVLSPHRGGGSTESEMQRMNHLAALLNAAARGEPIPNRVDLDAGY